jgi:transcriptional regulator with XRE-family HTH domain
MADIRHLLAANLAKLMDLSADCKSQNALAKKSKVAQTTIGNYLTPDSYVGYPSLKNIEKLAKCFGLDAWHLIHPTMGDKELTRQEIELYRKMREIIKEKTSPF